MTNLIAILVASIFLFGKYVQTNGNHPIGTHLLTLRNQYLRLYIHNKRSNIKTYLLEASVRIKDQTNVIYNKILSKYHDVHIAYYSLPEDNLELIERLISLDF